ncbi:MAG: response regulator [Candidatus Omnitrophota bacterium]
MQAKKRILVIEDDKDISRTLALRLGMEGFEVVTAFNGQEGLDKAKSMSEHLVILDLKLPGLPGEEICRQLRREKKYEHLPIIMLTAKDTDVDMVIGKVIGADYYIRKPFDMDELLVKVHSLLGDPKDSGAIR